MINIRNVEVTFEVTGDDSAVFDSHFGPAISKWWREVQRQAKDEEEGKVDRALMPPPRR